MNCDICHKNTTAGSHVNRGRYFEVHICPNCLMWSDDPRAVPVLKYGNAITEVDGIRFDSRKEAKYYEDLLWQQRTGAVKSIELQPEFVLQPAYEVAGKKIRPILKRKSTTIAT